MRSRDRYVYSARCISSICQQECGISSILLEYAAIKQLHLYAKHIQQFG